EISGQHIMTGGHCTLTRLVSQPISTGLRPRHSMWVVEEKSHPMDKVISSCDLLVSGLHLRIAAIQPFNKLFMNGRGNKIGRLDRQEDAAGKNRVDETSRVSDHGVVGTVVVLNLVGIVRVD